MEETDSALDLRTAKLDDLRGRDLSPAMMQRVEAPKPTWFVKRGEGKNAKIFPVEAREAWDMLNNRSQWKRRDFKFIGYSDGKTFHKLVKESISGARALTPAIDQKKAELNKYRAIEEKLIIDEVVDMAGDPKDAANEANKAKVLRLQKIIGRIDGELEKLEKQYRDLTRDVVKTAEAAELKVAMKNWKKKPTWPRAANIMTPNASPRQRRRVLGAMNQLGMSDD